MDLFMSLIFLFVFRLMEKISIHIQIFSYLGYRSSKMKNILHQNYFLLVFFENNIEFHFFFFLIQIIRNNNQKLIDNSEIGQYTIIFYSNTEKTNFLPNDKCTLQNWNDFQHTVIDNWNSIRKFSLLLLL